MTCCEGERRLERRWRRCASVSVEELVWLQIEARQGDQEVHRVVAKRIGERGGLGLTVDGEFERTRSQIWQTPASDFFLQEASRRERKGGAREEVEGAL
jgi:hypothetical protein